MKDVIGYDGVPKEVKKLGN